MGSAAAGLFSAAKSSIRRVENITKTISKAPDVTKEQKFGISYVQFFGSKKNSKILKKSLKSIRDSLVATFAIAKLLRSEVSKNVKLIGEKTKGKKGFFGLGLGGLLGLLSFLANPIVLGALGIGAGVAGLGFLGKFLFDNRDKIIEFIMDKTRGLYDFLMKFVSDVVSDFLGDRFKSSELRNVEEESEERISDFKKEFQEEGLSKNDAQVEAVKEEMSVLEKEISDLEAKPFLTSPERKRKKALTNRLDELKTGKVTTDKMGPITKKFFGKDIKDALRDQPVFIEGGGYGSSSNAEKIKSLKSIASKFQRQGNSLDTIRQIYGRAYDTNQLITPSGETRELTTDERMQAMDMIRYADQIQSSGNRSIDEKTFQPSSGTESNIKSNYAKSNNKKVSKVNSGGESGGQSGGQSGGAAASNPQITSGGQGLTQQPVAAKSAPDMVFHANFDPDNEFRNYNASLLNIFSL